MRTDGAARAHKKKGITPRRALRSSRLINNISVLPKSSKLSIFSHCLHSISVFLFIINPLTDIPFPFSSLPFFYSSSSSLPPSQLYSLLLGSPVKAESKLGWKRKVEFDALVKEMVQADLQAVMNLVEDQN